MPLDQTEIEAVKAWNESDSDDLPEVLAPLKGLAFIRNTKAENAYKETFKGQVITARDKELYDSQDALIKEEFGVDKKAGEKTSDYLKRAKSEALSSVETLKNELAELKKSGKVDGSTEAEKQRIAQLEGLLNAEKEARTKDAENYNVGLLSSRVDAAASSAVTVLASKLKASYTDDDKEAVVEAAMLKFRNQYTPKSENGGLVYYKKDAAGNDVLVTDPSTAKPKDTATILAEIFTPYVEKDKKLSGAGSGADGSKKDDDSGSGNPTADAYTPDASVKTRVALAEDLAKNGFVGGTKDFTALMQKHGYDKKLPLR